ncbi:MAG: N-6 DNA methylase [Candidatus Micrarchaeia archaeon]
MQVDELKQRLQIDFSSAKKKIDIEALRDKGQFWTPGWVAEAMVSYLFAGDKRTIFDPCVGAGAFFQAAKNVAKSLHQKIKLEGTEIDPVTLKEAIKNGLTEDDLSSVEIRDFVLNAPTTKIDAIVANPPYIRHHRISKNVKLELQNYSLKITGKKIDGRAGYHVYFLMKGLELLSDNGRLVFILPADVCEGKFSTMLWEWISTNFCIDAVIAFTPQASPFPKQDTNPIILMIRKSKPKPIFTWVLCNRAGTGELKPWILSNFTDTPKTDIDVYERTVDEALRTGFSRLPQKDIVDGRPLLDFATVMRGIATGANDFFFLTKEKAGELRIPANFLLNAIGKTRDVEGAEITEDTLEKIDAKGSPTLLLSLDGRKMDDFPPVIRNYLKKGEMMGIDRKTLISTRKPWYKMEIRSAPPFLFSYLGRKHARFIRNKASIVPLTGFLCVYPNNTEQNYLDRLENALNHPKTLENLKLVGKSYGGGAIKVEPRSLEQLIIPRLVLREFDLEH